MKEAQTLRTRDDQLLEETTVRKLICTFMSAPSMDAFTEGMFSSNLIVQQQLCKVSCPVIKKNHSI